MTSASWILKAEEICASQLENAFRDVFIFWIMSCPEFKPLDLNTVTATKSVMLSRALHYLSFTYKVVIWRMNFDWSVEKASSTAIHFWKTNWNHFQFLKVSISIDNSMIPDKATQNWTVLLPRVRSQIFYNQKYRTIRIVVWPMGLYMTKRSGKKCNIILRFQQQLSFYEWLAFDADQWRWKMGIFGFEATLWISRHKTSFPALPN